MEGIALLTEARSVGLIVRLDGEDLVIEGPPEQAPLAADLLAHKAAVVAVLRREAGTAAYAARLRAVYDALDARERTRFEAEVAADDPLAAMVGDVCSGVVSIGSSTARRKHGWRSGPCESAGAPRFGSGYERRAGDVV